MTIVLIFCFYYYDLLIGEWPSSNLSDSRFGLVNVFYSEYGPQHEVLIKQTSKVEFRGIEPQNRNNMDRQ